MSSPSVRHDVGVCVQAETLQKVADGRLASLEKRETGQTFAAANNSLTVLRIRDAQRVR